MNQSMYVCTEYRSWTVTNSDRSWTVTNPETSGFETSARDHSATTIGSGGGALVSFPSGTQTFLHALDRRRHTITPTAPADTTAAAIPPPTIAATIPPSTGLAGASVAGAAAGNGVSWPGLSTRMAAGTESGSTDRMPGICASLLALNVGRSAPPLNATTVSKDPVAPPVAPADSARRRQAPAVRTSADTMPTYATAEAPAAARHLASKVLTASLRSTGGRHAMASESRRPMRHTDARSAGSPRCVATISPTLTPNSMIAALAAAAEWVVAARSTLRRAALSAGTALMRAATTIRWEREKRARPAASEPAAHWKPGFTQNARLDLPAAGLSRYRSAMSAE
mmetsp:Transcript_53022/g.110610  ORF Transcript_53022/g.110610 Transcript_53022/m.110610 type:complete len:340 (+) Transcript_53022:55-1074(+)